VRVRVVQDRRVRVPAEAARRFLVARQLLAPPGSVTGGPAGVLEVVRALGSVQFDIEREEGVDHVLGLWWEDGFAPDRVPGFAEAMTETLNAYLRFAGADRLAWAPHLTAEQRLLPAHP
jgi:uncharacterized protein YcaQ